MICRTYQSVLSSDVLATIDVPANAFDLLRVPKREGVVVADGDEHAVRLDGVQQVRGEVARVAVAGARRPVPVREQRDEREREHRRAHVASCVSGRHVIVSRPTLTVSSPSSDATDSHTNRSPSAAHTPHAEKLQRKK